MYKLISDRSLVNSSVLYSVFTRCAFDHHFCCILIAVLRSYARIGAQLGLENEFFGCQHQKQFLGTNFILKTRHLKIQTSSTGVPEKFSTASEFFMLLIWCESFIEKDRKVISHWDITRINFTPNTQSVLHFAIGT